MLLICLIFCTYVVYLANKKAAPIHVHIAFFTFLLSDSNKLNVFHDISFSKHLTVVLVFVLLSMKADININTVAMFGRRNVCQYYGHSASSS